MCMMGGMCVHDGRCVCMMEGVCVCMMGGRCVHDGR